MKMLNLIKFQFTLRGFAKEPEIFVLWMLSEAMENYVLYNV